MLVFIRFFNNKKFINKPKMSSYTQTGNVTIYVLEKQVDFLTSKPSKINFSVRAIIKIHKIQPASLQTILDINSFNRKSI